MTPVSTTRSVISHALRSPTRRPRTPRPSALLVAKWHKLGERLVTPRLEAKDAGDVYRLYDVVDTRGMAQLIARLLADERSSEANRPAFAMHTSCSPPRRTRVLAVDALEAVLPPATVATVVTRYTQELLETLPSS